MKNFMNTGMTAILAGFLLLFPVTEAAAAEKVSGQSAPAPVSGKRFPDNLLQPLYLPPYTHLTAPQ